MSWKVESNVAYLELEAWLADATHGIGAIGRKRIREDIGSHLERARSVALDAGASEDDAVAQAVAALGDAGKARKRFRRTQLTAKQELVLEQRISYIGKRSSNPLNFHDFFLEHGWGVLMLPVFIVVLIVLSQSFAVFSTLIAMCVVFMLLSHFTTDVLLARMIRERRFGVPLLVGCIVELIAGVMLFPTLIFVFDPAIFAELFALNWGMYLFFPVFVLTQQMKLLNLVPKLFQPLSEIEISLLTTVKPGSFGASNQYKDR